MSIEMEIPKVLWLKNSMPKELFERCKFYDLADALTHLATANEKRSFCSVVCKQGYIPVGVDGSVKGWQEGFLEEIGLNDLTEDSFKRVGGVNGVVRLVIFLSFLAFEDAFPSRCWKAKKPSTNGKYVEWEVPQCGRAGRNTL